jgi:hypothetical protein
MRAAFFAACCVAALGALRAQAPQPTRQYIELTKTWIARLRSGDDGGPPIVLRWPDPRALPDLSWGGEAKGAVEVAADYAANTRRGLREVACGDGRSASMARCSRRQCPLASAATCTSRSATTSRSTRRATSSS